MLERPSRPFLTKLTALLMSALLVLTWAQPALAAPPATDPGGSEGNWYIVQRGDVLGTIAVRHNTTTRAIALANNLSNPDVIHVGQRLWIPTESAPTPPEADPAPAPEPEAPSEGSWYVVRSGDTLGSIAARHGTTSAVLARANTLTNPNRIHVGQRLWIPSASAPTPPGADPAPEAPEAPPPSEPEPEAPSDGTWYVVRSGDTLGAIASRHGTTSAALARANNLANPNVIRVGQRLWIPGSSGTGPAPAPAPAPGPLPPSASSAFAYGFQIQPWGGADLGHAINATRDAGFTWLKIQVPWFMIEGAGKGQYDWNTLDHIVNTINGGGLRLLVSICKAPHWARPGNTDLSVEGPPANAQDLADFVGALAARYRGRVHAIEVWNEQNLHYEWGNESLDARRYVDMLCRSYQAIKAQDRNIFVIAGAPTPTGVNDGVVAIDDVVYVEQMYQAGCKNCMDGLGAHPSGYNNPPGASFGYTDPAEPDFKGHPSFFFHDTMVRYRQVMVRYGDSRKAIWPTEFGWASSPNPVAGYEYASQVTEQEQAAYLVEALRMMRNWGYVGPAFVWNLNFGITNPGTELAQFAVWGRPAYDALRSIPK